MSWIGRNHKKLVLFGMFVLIVEFGIGVWRLPSEFRFSVYPKLAALDKSHSDVVLRCNEAIDVFIARDVIYMNEIRTLHIKEDRSSMRIDLLSEIEERKVLLLKSNPSEKPDSPVHHLPLPPSNPQDFHRLEKDLITL